VSYHRHPAALGRVRGGTRARSVGAIEEMGTSVMVQGDPVVALIAQLNRFAGKQVTLSSGKKATYVKAPFALATGKITDAIATSAAMILVDRFQDAPLETYDQTSVDWAIAGLAGDTVAFVTGNLATITVAISQFGDKLGLEPAKVGITKRDPRFQPNTPWGIIALLGALTIGAVVVARKAG